MTHYGMRIRMGVAILVAAALAATGPAGAQASGVAESAFSYNDNGNSTLYNGVSPAYNEDDQLTTFGSLTAGYRSDGLRCWKDSGTGRRYFLYSGTTPVCELNPDGTIAAVNTFGPTGLLSRRENGQDQFYTFDPQGSVSRILDSTGTVSATQLYDAYGTLLHGAASYPYGFGAQYGYYTDQETDLLLLTHRYYDPSEGRFLTRDPIGYAGGMNLYAYCGNNPVNAVDPLGFCGDRTAASPPIAGGFPVGPKGILPNFLREANPFNRNSALFRQGISIGDFFRGDWRGAAANSGWAMMQESNCSRAEFDAYAAVQAVGLASACAAGGEVAAEAAATSAATAANTELEGSKGGSSGSGDITKLTPGEIKALERAGYDVHDLKPGKPVSTPVLKSPKTPKEIPQTSVLPVISAYKSSSYSRR